MASGELGFARDVLIRLIANYHGIRRGKVVLVFDAYKVQGNTGKKFNYNNIRVVYTKERELGDNYIEKLISDIGKNDNVRVVTSDNLIQLSAVRFGVLRVSAKEFEREVSSINKIIDELLYKINKPRPQKIGDMLQLIKEIKED